MDEPGQRPQRRLPALPGRHGDGTARGHREGMTGSRGATGDAAARILPPRVPDPRLTGGSYVVPVPTGPAPRSEGKGRAAIQGRARSDDPAGGDPANPGG